MMESIVGLVLDDAHVTSVEQELQAAGFADDKVHELLGPADFWTRLCSKEKTRLVCRYAAVGALIGLGFGAIYGAFPIVLNCKSGCPVGTGLILLALFVLFCAASGLLFGAFFGLDRAERSLLTYLNDTHRDQALFVVEASTENAKEVRHILERHGVIIDVDDKDMTGIERQRSD
ncbi:MAG: hypothetical protein PVH65_12150 [Chloroflexota bacterium]|jgi:hypothetical protein